MNIVNIDQLRINNVAEILKNLPDKDYAPNFYSFNIGGKEIVADDMFPPLNHPEAINFFFFACLHDHGFWYGDDIGYVKPLFGIINGKKCKGSDLLWKALKKAFDKDNLIFSPERLAYIEPEELFYQIFRDDNGSIPFPNLEERFQMTRAYGRLLAGYNITPAEIVRRANEAQESLSFFIHKTLDIRGYNDDDLRKRNFLLAMILANRPEKFLIVNDPQNWRPIVDYHLMRLALRLGLADLNDKKIKRENQLGLLVDWKTEFEIRAVTWIAVNELIERSSKSMFFVDQIMWNARKYCPEMEMPNCDKCIFTGVCAKRVELFQPVFRTTNY